VVFEEKKGFEEEKMGELLETSSHSTEAPDE
jgi:hypothetical protein